MTTQSVPELGSEARSFPHTILPPCVEQLLSCLKIDLNLDDKYHYVKILIEPWCLLSIVRYKILTPALRPETKLDDLTNKMITVTRTLAPLASCFQLLFKVRGLSS